MLLISQEAAITNIFIHGSKFHLRQKVFSSEDNRVVLLVEKFSGLLLLTGTVAAAGDDLNKLFWCQEQNPLLAIEIK